MAPNCILAFAGDEADMKEAIITIKEQVNHAHANDLEPPTAKEIHGTLALQSYEARNEGKPILNNFLVAGPRFLGAVDVFGMSFEPQYYASSIGRYYCVPLMRAKWNAQMTHEEAVVLAEDCVRLMWYNDCLASKEYDLWAVTSAGI